MNMLKGIMPNVWTIARNIVDVSLQNYGAGSSPYILKSLIISAMLNTGCAVAVAIQEEGIYWYLKMGMMNGQANALQRKEVSCNGAVAIVLALQQTFRHSNQGEDRSIQAEYFTPGHVASNIYQNK